MSRAVRTAVLKKWLQYMNHIYMSKVLTYRRAMHRHKFAFVDIRAHFDKEYAAN